MEVDGVTIEKPQEDYREYFPLILENGLRAIVISDPKAEKAAAALSVNVGSLFDPKEVQGLAHFCEHMLFLGTEKYPEENAYQEFISKHGGSTNAYTAESVTNYHFDISADHLESALDRFSQFFISPLFTESATDRELQAVASEHSKNTQSDMWRWMQLLKNDANPKHPMSHFGTGNMETLKEKPGELGFHVREQLLEFHQKYYSANIMCLAVLGKQSLNELAELVRTKFGPVENRNVQVPSGPELGGGEEPFVFTQWPRLVRCLPVRDLRAATFQWVLPQQRPMRWRTKPTRYLGFLLGHEGEGSLLSCLKAKGLATELTAGASQDDGGACVFEVGIQMTEAGEKQVDVIGECLFAYVRLIQQSPVSEELWLENQCIEEMNFRFRSVGQPMGTVTNLAHSMQDNLPVDKVLSGPSKVWDFDSREIVECAGLFTLTRLRVFLAMKSFTEEEHCKETEHWYGTRFGAEALLEEWRERWQKARVGDNNSDDSAAAAAAAGALGLALPKKNPFVPQDLELKPQPAGGVPKEPVKVDPATTAVPSKVMQVYFRQDDTFKLPKAIMQVVLYCPWVWESLEHRILTRAWASAVMEELNEFSYDADVAGLVHSVSSHPRGVTVNCMGYHDKLPELLRTVTEKMAALREVPEHTWSIVHTVLERGYKNAATKMDPLRQAREWESRCLSRAAVTSGEQLACFQGVTREKVGCVAEKLLESCYAEALLQGNLADPGGIVEALRPTLQPTSLLERIPSQAIGALPDGPGSCVLVRRTGTNPQERNGAVTLLLQAADEELSNVVFAELAGQVLGSRCFDELRTKQQLGYIVGLQPFADRLGGNGFCGLIVVVQSEKHPAEVHRRIDAWLAEALASLTDEAQSPNEDLTQYVEALLTRYKEKPKKLVDEFTRHWGEVSQRRFQFSRRDQVIAFLQRPPSELLPEFRAFTRERLQQAPRLAVEVLGAAAAATAAAGGEAEVSAEAAAEAKPYEGATVELESLEDIEAFRKRLNWRESISAIAA